MSGAALRDAQSRAAHWLAAWDSQGPHRTADVGNRMRVDQVAKSPNAVCNPKRHRWRGW